MKPYQVRIFLFSLIILACSCERDSNRELAITRFDSVISLLDSIKKVYSNEIIAIEFSPNFKLLGISGKIGRENILTVWNLEDRTLQYQFSLFSWLIGQGFAFSYDSKHIAAHTDYGVITVYNAENGNLQQSLKGKGMVHCLSFSPIEKFLAAGYENTAVIWDLDLGKQIDGFPNRTEIKNEPKSSPDDPVELLSEFWDLIGSTKDLKAKADYVNDIAFSPNGRLIAVAQKNANNRGEVRIWDIKAGIKIKTLDDYEHGIEAVDFSPSGEKLAVGTSDNILELWDTNSWSSIKLLSESKPIGQTKMGTHHQYIINSVRFSPDGKILASGHQESYSDVLIRIWDVEKERDIWEFRGSRNEGKYDANSLQFSPNGRYLLCGGSRFISLFEIPALTASELLQIKPIDTRKSGNVDENNRLTLFPFITKGKYGFINTQGKIIVDPNFDDVNNFNEGFAAVQKDGKWGYINNKGHLAITPQYYTTHGNRNFSEGLACVCIGDISGAKCGYIDKSGKIVIPLQYAISGVFSEGLAWVGIDNKKGFINTDGVLVIQTKFKRVQSFSGGLAAVCLPEGEWGYSKWGFINTTGEFVIEPQFDDVSSFKEGYAQVEKGERQFYINKNGKAIIYPPSSFYNEGLAPVNVGSRLHGEWGYMDKNSNFIIEPQFKEALEFTENLAAVKTVEGKWGYIDRTGSFVIEPKFDFAKSFEYGIATVGVGGTPKHFFPYYARRHGTGKLGYIDRLGDYVWIQKD